MFFKIEKSGCMERDGKCQIRYDVFFDNKEEASKEEGTVVVGFKTYEEWIGLLPKFKDGSVLLCCHFCYFDPEVTDEELLYVGELVLDMCRKSWIAGNIDLNKNDPFIFYAGDEGRITACVERISKVKDKDFSTVQVGYSSKLRG